MRLFLPPGPAARLVATGRARRPVGPFGPPPPALRLPFGAPTVLLTPPAAASAAAAAGSATAASAASAATATATAAAAVTAAPAAAVGLVALLVAVDAVRGWEEGAALTVHLGGVRVWV